MASNKNDLLAVLQVLKKYNLKVYYFGYQVSL